MQEKLKKVFSNQQAVVVIALVVICIAFSVMTPKFMQLTTFTNIAKSAYYISFMAIGVTFVICTGGIDLSIGTVAICSTLIGGTMMEAGLPMPLVILVILLTGCLFGLLNGLMVSKLGLPAFIATLGTMMISAAWVLLYPKLEQFLSHRVRMRAHGSESCSW